MNLENLDKGLDQADGLLTKLKTILKKHWGILLLIFFLSMGYFVWNSDDVSTDDETQQVDGEESTDESVDETIDESTDESGEEESAE